MRKFLMTLAAGVMLLGTTISTKAVNLIKDDQFKYDQEHNDDDFILKHAKDIFSPEEDSFLSQHVSHSSHASHSSHTSHRSHTSHSSHSSHSSHYSFFG